jgi:hypothetical protein
VRSTVASLEAVSTRQQVAKSPALRPPLAAPSPQLALAGPTDARGQLRYLHHRVAGASTPHSRDMLR